MMPSLWSRSITFGLVSIPGRLEKSQQKEEKQRKKRA